MPDHLIMLIKDETTSTTRIKWSGGSIGEFPRHFPGIDAHRTALPHLVLSVTHAHDRGFSGFTYTRSPSGADVASSLLTKSVQISKVNKPQEKTFRNKEVFIHEEER
jgi:hypothetical protein